MFLEEAYEDFIEDIRDVFERASTVCEDAVSDLESLAWDYDEVLTALEDGEDHDEDAVEQLVERFQNKIERAAEDASSCGSEVDYYDAHRAIEEALKDELRRANYDSFAELL